MQWVCHNGAFVPGHQPLFTAANRSFKWGDGVFETALFYKGALQLSHYHFNRLFSGLQVLKMNAAFTRDELISGVVSLCEKNACTQLARVRIAVYREEDNRASYVIEAIALPPEITRWNDTGWQLLLYPFARKSCDAFSNLKTANYLPYLMAGIYAKEAGADECLILNMHNHICDGSKTNLFYIKGDAVYTPALSEGCVAGVMRRYVIEVLKSSGYVVHQKAVTEDDILGAAHVFVTNAIEGMRWVQRFGDSTYGYGVLKKLHRQLFEAFYT